jgi:hypothetical protein
LELILSQPKSVSVNGIIQLMQSVCLGPKVIPLSGAHCIIKSTFLCKILQRFGISLLETMSKWLYDPKQLYKGLKCLNYQKSNVTAVAITSRLAVHVKG